MKHTALLCRSVTIIIVAYVVGVCCRKEPEKQFAVFGYLPEYRLNNFDYEGVFSSGLTHLIFFSLEIDKQTSLPKALDRLPSKADVQRARIAADSVNGKLLISFGGNARSDGFGEMTSTPKTRHKFLTALDKLLEEYNLDGVDYNWEYPRSAEEWDSWGLLMRESKQLLLQHRRKKRINKSQNITNTNTDTNANETLSSTSSGDETVKSVTRSSVPVVTFTMYLDANHYKVIQHFDLLTTADYVHCMAYDSRGKHSTIDFAKQGIELAQSVFGLRSKQWTLGLPFYGRDVNTGEPKAYYELTEPLALLSVPERTKTDIVESVYFNNYDTLRQKIKLARDRKAGGVMIWELGQDIQPFNRSNSLMKAVRDSIISQSDTPNDDTLSTIGTEGGVIHEEL